MEFLYFLLLLLVNFIWIDSLSHPTRSRFSTTRKCSTSNFATGHDRQQIIARYTDRFPTALFRICGKSRSIVLREYAVQTSKGSRSFDVTLAEDGLIHPSPLDDIFIGPNGASLRPAGINLWDILSSKRGTTNILEIPVNSKLPDSLVLLHEHGDHYSLQCTRPMKRKMLEGLMNNFIENFPFFSKEEYFQRYPLAQR